MIAENNYKSGFVAIAGRPNVGKSTLMNHLIKQKIAIMSDKPQTTRNRIQGIYTNEQMQIVFIDTPGIHKPKHKLGEFMNKQAITTLPEVDIVMFLVDVSEVPGAGDHYVAELLNQSSSKVFLILNKIDKIDKGTLLERIAQYSKLVTAQEVIPVAALTGENTDRLMEVIEKNLEHGPMFFPADQLTDHPERFIISELIREKVLQLTHEEIPHSVAVVVDQVTKRKNTERLFIAATIFVERSSQKGILIGKQGKLLKEAGKRARADIERLLGNPIYLDLWIKVKKDWRNRAVELKNFGFFE